VVPAPQSAAVGAAPTRTGGTPEATPIAAGPRPSLQTLFGRPEARGATPGTGEPMPAAVQARMERAFAADFSAVRIHQGAHPLEIGAVAYTEGTDIHMAPGHYDPLGSRGQELLGHELAHVVQQRQGRVQPSASAQGVAINDDAGLEAEADRAGRRAATGEHIAELGGSGGAAASSTAQRKVIQRAEVHTQYGTFRDPYFEEKKSAEDNSVEGVDIHLTFTPGAQANATKIGLVQSVRNLVNGEPIAVDPTKRDQMVPDGEARGYGIDKLSNTRNPLYATSAEPLHGADQLETYATEPYLGEHGHRYHDGTHWQVKDAKLLDAPTCPAQPNASLTFETTALAIEGVQKDTYYGSVSWGVQADGEGKLSKVELQKVSDAKPSGNFTKAAEQWNASKVQGTLEIARDGVKILGEEEFVLNKGAVVYQTNTGLHEGVPYLEVVHAGKPGLVAAADVVDRRDGQETVKLPVVA